MNRFLLSANIVITVLLLSACGRGSKASAVWGEAESIGLRHADNLTLFRTADYAVACLRNPWDTTRVLHTYVLVDKDRPLPDSLPEGTLVRTPLSKAVVYSSVHCSLLVQLGALGSIGGVCDRKYIKLPQVQQGCLDGTIVDAGEGMNPDIERIIELHPDAILLSPFENSGGYGRIEKLGVPIIECADYMETSALGRAEWMRFYGLLFGEAARADSLFAVVEHEYNALKALPRTAQPAGPTVLSELKSGSAWYVPGGNSTTGRLYADAGARYVFADYPQSGSVPLAFETVFDRGQHADCWLIKYNRPSDMTYADLREEYAPYAGFRAFRERRVYGCNTGRVPFYEESPFRPDRLLKDLVKIFHPSLLEGYEPVYFHPLQEHE